MDQTQPELDRRTPGRFRSTSSPSTQLAARSSNIVPDGYRPHAATMQSAMLEDHYPATRLRAIQDAAEMQDIAVKQCYEADTEIPPYTLTELIGKGSFGRVYKATAAQLHKTVAVKIMSIEEGDCLAPGRSDTFSEILKEVKTLRILNDGGARNINRLIECILVGHSMWVVTDYCAGGSVATLMRPAGFLPERWIIPILREVAEALYWVHKHGIIHRDLKCANVLIAEGGGVQLCDFGVAGIVKSKVDKRSTITGTLQWMAPELFGNNVAYGSEVDIWAFGSMAYEAATGFPPNATTILDMDLGRFGAYLKESCPRLQGGEYSDQLKDLVSSCMVADPATRPRIEQLQKHPYILNTHTIFPTSSLKDLVRSYREWENRGGNRQSLFNQGGAQSHARSKSISAVEGQGWDYGTMDQADQALFDTDQEEGSGSLPKARPLLPPLLTRGQRHGRRVPADIKPVNPPLAKVFDPNTLVNYQDHVKAFYQQPSPTGDPKPSSTQVLVSPASLGDTSNDATIRESPIGTSCSHASTALVSPITPDDDLTIKPPRNQTSSVVSSQPPQLQLQSDTSRTQDWTFPIMLPEPTPDANSQDGGTNSTVSSSNLPSLSGSSSRTLSVGGMDVAVSPITPINDTPWSRYSQRSDGLTISSGISLIDLDASLVSLTPPGVRLTPTYTTNKSNQTERFPEFSSPPTNGTSLAPIPDSSLMASDMLQATKMAFSSTASALKSPSGLSRYEYTSKYQSYQAQELQPSPVLHSKFTGNGFGSQRSTQARHRYNDRGHYPSSLSVSNSLSRESSGTDSPTYSLGSLPGTPLRGALARTETSPCPTIDETLVDETPPRYRHNYGLSGPELQREPSLYVPCEEDEDKPQDGGKYRAGEMTDPSLRKLYLPQMILGSRPSSPSSDDVSTCAASTGKASAQLGGGSSDPPRRNGGMATDMRRPGAIRTDIARKTKSLGGDNNSSRGFVSGPMLPDPPRPDVISGEASKEAVKEELTRLLGSMASHLQHSANVMMGLPVVRPPLMPSVVKNNGAKTTSTRPATGGGRAGKKAASKDSSG